MLQSYPVTFTPDENDTIIAEFPDVPEAMTVGSDEKNAIQWAQDALIVALTGYIEDRRDIPPPSKAQKGQKSVNLPPQIAMKLAIYQSMRDQGITQAENYPGCPWRMSACRWPTGQAHFRSRSQYNSFSTHLGIKMSW